MNRGSSPMRAPLAAGRATSDQWFEPYFRFVRETALVKPFCYISMKFPTFPEWSEWGDCRLHTNRRIIELYIEELRRECYLHQGWWQEASGRGSQAAS